MRVQITKASNIPSLADTGTGMDEETRGRVCGPFFTTRPKDASSGLGMAIVYDEVRALAGYPDIASALGQGTTVRVLLPAVPGCGDGRPKRQVMRT